MATLRRNRASAAAAVLALGIGATPAVFSLLLKNFDDLTTQPEQCIPCHIHWDRSACLSKLALGRRAMPRQAPQRCDKIVRDMDPTAAVDTRRSRIG